MNLKSISIFLRMKFLLSLLCLFICVPSIGQILKFDYDEYNQKDGLSHNSIRCITQDHSGFIWFGSEEGLNRFDGYDFKTYKHVEGNPRSLVSNAIHCLFTDNADSSIWIGTDNGVNQFFPKTNQIKHFSIDFTDESKLNGAYVSSINKRSDGSIWITYIGSGVDVIYPGVKNIFHYTIHRNDQYKISSDMVSSLQFMEDGYTLFSTYDGLQVLDASNAVLSEDKALEKYQWKDSIEGTIKILLLNRENTVLWIGTEVHGLYQVNLKTNAVQNYNVNNSDMESNDILEIFEDSKGTIWIGSNAIYQYDDSLNTLKWYNDHGMYLKTHTQSIYEDQDENIWFGTIRLGVRKISMQNKMVAYFHSNQGEGGLKTDEILSFNEDATEQIYIGTGGVGLVKLIPGTNTFSDSHINSKLHSQTIKTIFKDRKDNFWMGGWDLGLVMYNPIQNVFKQYHPKEGNFNSHHVWDIAEDRQGNLWLGTLRDGLCRFSPETGKYNYYNYKPGDSSALINDDVISLYVDSRNILWAGTGNGLSVMLPGAEAFINLFKFKTNDKYSLSNSVILCIAEDSKGRIWLGTKGGGITIVNVKNDEIFIENTLKEIDGLPSNNINSILPDKENNAWVTSSNGLAKINIEDFSVLETKHIPGLEGGGFIEQADFKAEDGRLFFGGSRGFHVFHPDSLDLKPIRPDVFFTDLKIVNDNIEPDKKYRGRKYIENRITETEKIVLYPDDYAFTLDFSSITYNRQENISYTYFLENFDKEWQFTDENRRFAHYTNLAPGDYKLHVRASFENKYWTEEAKVLNIHVEPPWYGVVWFKISIVSVFFLMMLGLFVGRDKFLKRQQNKLENLVIIRTAELERSNGEIQKLLEEVANQKAKIEIKNNELHDINEEVGAQRDNLERKSNELEKIQLKLQETNLHLEKLVEKRTEILNNTLLELETFLYRASHDLQGPISTMKGLVFLALLESKKLEESDRSDYSLLFEQPVLKLEGTLKKLLQKHAIQKHNVFLEEFDESSILRFIYQVVKDINGGRREDLEIIIEDNICFETDKEMFSIVLLSLLENAFHYSQYAQNNKVILRISLMGEDVVISVKDFGIGIKTDIRDKIFTKFYRGTELSKGNGLGLYLLKTVLEKINGSIEVESVEGCFSKFTVFIKTHENIKCKNI